MVCRGKIEPEKLPPTDDAARLHGLRAHHQIITWSSLGNLVKPPTDWGWKICGDVLSPIQTTLSIAPPELEKIIRCKCSTAGERPCSTNTCTCRKNGLHCVQACRNCRGESCCNSQVSFLYVLHNFSKTKQHKIKLCILNSGFGGRCERK